MKIQALYSVVLTLIFTGTAGAAATYEDAKEAMEPLLGSCPNKFRIQNSILSCLAKKSPMIVCQNRATAVALRDRPRTNAQVIANYMPEKAAMDSAIESANLLLESVAHSLPIPAVDGVIENFTGGFLPSLLQTSGQLPEPQTLGFAVNLPRYKILRVRLGGFGNPQAELNPALESVLSERSQLGAFRGEEKDLDLADDYYLTANIAVVGTWFGNEMADHRMTQSRVSRTSLAGRDLKGQDFDKQTFLTYAQVLADGRKYDDHDLLLASCALDKYNRIAQSDIQRETAHYLGDFWRLVHNQPQLLFSARQLRRDDIVGADIESYRIKFSTGLLNNVNFLKWTHACDKNLGGDACPQAFESMVGGFAARHGLGLSAYYEWGNLADVSVKLPSLVQDPQGLLLPPIINDQLVDDDDVFHLDGGDYRRYGWSLGAMLKANITSDGSMESSMRIDGGMDYYRYDRDPVRIDHDVTRLTLTYRRGQFSIPFHLMYRTETEFEADLGDDLVFGVGLQTSFDQF